ncbi:putative ammonium transporter 1 [Antedon mediterranea]|uniref:putative ammonium transporter 1 n=1 Tax=Antedon mediterranea TaxID=105859 RepID=UPI003AF45521
MGGGFWGIIAVTFFARDTGIVYSWDSDSGLRLVWNVVGAIAIFSWSVCTSLLMFGSMRAAGILRVSRAIEIKGLDIAKHGEPAYPLTAYGHGWVNIVEAETELENGENGMNRSLRQSIPEHITLECHVKTNGQHNNGLTRE